MKTKSLIGCAITAQLICACSQIQFSHDAAPIYAYSLSKQVAYALTKDWTSSRPLSLYFHAYIKCHFTVSYFVKPFFIYFRWSITKILDIMLYMTTYSINVVNTSSRVAHIIRIHDDRLLESYLSLAPPQFLQQQKQQQKQLATIGKNMTNNNPRIKQAAKPPNVLKS